MLIHVQPARISAFEEVNVKNKTNVINILLFCNEMANISFGDKLYHPQKICVKNIAISAQYCGRKRRLEFMW